MKTDYNKDDIWNLWITLEEQCPDRFSAIQEFWIHAQGVVRTSDYNRGREDGLAMGYLKCETDLRNSLRPISISDRLPGPEDCDEQDRCWWWRDDGVEDFWELICLRDPIGYNQRIRDEISYGPWLPFYAIPNPEKIL